MASHDQVRLLTQEIANQTQRLDLTISEFNKKADFLNGENTLKQTLINELQQANTRLMAASSGGGGKGGGGGLGQLLNLKTMQPKIFGGKDNESFRGWAKKVRSYCNASQPGFKKFLKWIEGQSDAIPMDFSTIPIAWESKVKASEVMFDFLMMHTSDNAQIVVELSEDNGPEAWRQLV